MQTLILNHSAILPLKVIEHLNLHSGDQITFRITDDEGTMIAKVNGKGNLKTCEAMIRAFNTHDQMKTLLKNRLKEILQQIIGSSLLAISTRQWIREGKSFDSLVEQLQSQMRDNPSLMLSAIGGEAVQILQVV